MSMFEFGIIVAVTVLGAILGTALHYKSDPRRLIQDAVQVPWFLILEAAYKIRVVYLLNDTQRRSMLEEFAKFRLRTY